MKKHVILMLGLVLALTSLTSISIAQDGITRITLSVTDNLEDTLNNGVLEEFYALYPNVEVTIEATGGGRFGRGGGGVDTATVEETMQYADVALVNSSQLSIQTTRAGLFLDMSPLASVDTSLNIDDYYYPVWQSYQWDNSIWALPVAVDPIVMMYTPDDFDQLGLPYPSEWWTLGDIADNVRQLAQYDEDGTLSQQPLVDIGGYIPQIMVSLMGDNVIDETVFPVAPDFSNPQLADMMTQWATLQEEGLVGGFGGDGSFDATIMFGPSIIATRARFAGDREFVALPGGRTALDIQAFAISAGTQQPEVAYELAKFLTQSAEVANSVNSTLPARRSLAGINTDTSSSGGGGGRTSTSTDPAVLEILQSALESGIATSEIQFSEYIDTAISLMISDSIDAPTALQDVELTALDDLAASETTASERTWVVEPPVVTNLTDGEIALNFGISNTQAQAPDSEATWESVIADFVATDAQVGAVNIDSERGLGGNITTLAETYDCFYMDSNAVQGADLSLLVSLDPLLFSDPSFDQFGFVGDILPQVQSGDQTWAYPLNIQPEVMLYDQLAFDYAGAFYPYVGWTVTDFENALRDLKLDPEDDAPFAPVNFGGTYMQILLAAYGGPAVDYSTSPVSLNYTNEATLNAAQQVLDLAKAGYIEYTELAGIGGNSRFRSFDEAQVDLYNQLINSFLIEQVNQTDYNYVTYPAGTQNVAIAYDIGAAYISSNTMNIDACYRLIQHVAESAPTLFSQMPARRDQLTSQALVTAQGQPAVDFYAQLDMIMTDPNITLIPTAFSGGIESIGESLVTNWLYQAFDNYVLEDADLATGLEDAQLKATAFQECIQGLDAFDPNLSNPEDYFADISACATTADPDFSLFGN
jgi:ABC-type glycerol-3-phosphate transport system substrate-binding protein